MLFYTYAVLYLCCSIPMLFYTYAVLALLALDTLSNVTQIVKCLIRFPHPQDGSTYPRYKVMCFLYITCYFYKEQNALAFNWDTWCHLALRLQMILLHCVALTKFVKANPVLSVCICLSVSV